MRGINAQCTSVGRHSGRANARQLRASKNSIGPRNEVMVPYSAGTDSITVTVRPVYLDQQTDVMSGRFVFGYLVRITNEGYDEVQLRSEERRVGKECRAGWAA